MILQRLLAATALVPFLAGLAFGQPVDARNPVFNAGAGIVVGAPTGGDLGSGTVNAQDGYFVNGQAIGGALTIPNACVIGGTGTALTGVTLGSNLSCTNGTLSATGGGTPGGTTGQVQFNNAGAFGGLPVGLTGNSTIIQTNSNGLLTPSILPIATTSALGGIVPDGTTISVNPSTGLASAIGSAATSVTVGTTTVGGGSSGNLLSISGTTLANITTSGTGSVALTTSPVFVTPVLGTPSSGVLTNATGYPAAALVGSSLPSGVTGSSLTSLGTLTRLVVSGTGISDTSTTAGISTTGPLNYGGAATAGAIGVNGAILNNQVTWTYPAGSSNSIRERYQFDTIHVLPGATTIINEANFNGQNFGFPVGLTPATITATEVGGAVTALTISPAGSGYAAGTYALTFVGGGGSGAAGTFTVDGTGTVVSTNLTAGGSAYTAAPGVYQFDIGAETNGHHVYLQDTAGIVFGQQENYEASNLISAAHVSATYSYIALQHYTTTGVNTSALVGFEWAPTNDNTSNPIAGQSYNIFEETGFLCVAQAGAGLAPHARECLKNTDQNSSIASLGPINTGSIAPSGMQFFVKNLIAATNFIEFYSSTNVQLFNLSDAGVFTFDGPMTAPDLATGTQISCLGLTSANQIVAASGACVTGGGGSGTVTSITAGAGLTGGTITASGTIALDLTAANTWTNAQTITGINSSDAFNALTVASSTGVVGLAVSNAGNVRVTNGILVGIAGSATGKITLTNATASSGAIQILPPIGGVLTTVNVTVPDNTGTLLMNNLNQTISGTQILSGILNVTGTLESGGVAGVSCAANSVSLTTLVVTGGVVTHC